MKLGSRPLMKERWLAGVWGKWAREAASLSVDKSTNCVQVPPRKGSAADDVQQGEAHRSPRQPRGSPVGDGRSIFLLRLSSSFSSSEVSSAPRGRSQRGETWPSRDGVWGPSNTKQNLGSNKSGTERQWISKWYTWRLSYISWIQTCSL